MYMPLSFALFATATVAQLQYTSTGAAAVAAAKATAITESPVSNVAGKTFDRFITIWLENTDYSLAAADPNLAWLATQGKLLTNYLAITHPSQGNYVAAVGGALNGVSGDSFTRIASSKKTIVDLLEAKGVSWGVYGESSPYSGFEGNYVNQKTGANDYVRKHKLAKLKNFTMFTTDLKNNALPQWAFLTPNMTNDGHDTSVTTAGKWARGFLTPLLANPNFLKRTLVLLTFDETANYLSNNKVFSVLLGDALPASAKGTKDAASYNHYSQMATVENNWSLGNLGLADATATKFF